MWRDYCLYLVLRLFLFSLSFSQAEAEEKKKEEERSKRESGNTTSFAVSGISPINPTWHYLSLTIGFIPKFIFCYMPCSVLLVFVSIFWQSRSTCFPFHFLPRKILFTHHGLTQISLVPWYLPWFPQSDCMISTSEFLDSLVPICLQFCYLV